MNTFNLKEKLPYLLLVVVILISVFLITKISNEKSELSKLNQDLKAKNEQYEKAKLLIPVSEECKDTIDHLKTSLSTKEDELEKVKKELEMERQKPKSNVDNDKIKQLEEKERSLQSQIKTLTVKMGQLRDSVKNISKESNAVQVGGDTQKLRLANENLRNENKILNEKIQILDQEVKKSKVENAYLMKNNTDFAYKRGQELELQGDKIVVALNVFKNKEKKRKCYDEALYYYKNSGNKGVPKLEGLNLKMDKLR